MLSLSKLYKAIGKRLASKELVIAETTSGCLIIKRDPEEHEIKRLLNEGVEVVAFPDHIKLPQGCAVI